MVASTVNGGNDRLRSGKLRRGQQSRGLSSRTNILQKRFLSIQINVNHAIGYFRMIFRIICVRSIALALSLPGLFFINKIPRVTFSQTNKTHNFSTENDRLRHPF